MTRNSLPPGHTIVQDNRRGQISYWQNDYHQSAADTHGVSTADYIHAMYSFLRQADSRDVLMIGCGGGTLATMLARGGANVTVVDLNDFSFDIARAYFHLPPQVRCHVGDGATFLRRERHRYDAIVLDAFDEGGMPEEFKKPAFFRLAKSRLKSRGSLFLMNVLVDDDNDRTPDNLVRAMRRLWRRVRLLDTDGWVDRNAVIAAGAVANLHRPRPLMLPRPGALKLARQLAILNFRAVRR